MFRKQLLGEWCSCRGVSVTMHPQCLCMWVAAHCIQLPSAYSCCLQAPCGEGWTKDRIEDALPMPEEERIVSAECLAGLDRSWQGWQGGPLVLTVLPATACSALVV